MNPKLLILTLALGALLAAGATAQPPMRGADHGNLWDSLSADFDLNQDGEITLEELGGAEATFAQMDQNGDGTITVDDFASRGRRHGIRMRRGLAGGFLVRAADGDGDGTVTSAEFDAFLGDVDADGDGVIEEDELRSALGGGPGGGHREFRRPEGQRPEAGHPFDRDQDGVLEVEDFQQVFAEIDANSDGEVSGDEAPRFGFRERRRSRGRGPGGAGRGAMIAHHADADQDGEITQAEWQGFVGQLDADGSGEIDAGEWLAAMPGPPDHEPSPEIFDRLTRVFDRNGNGVLEISDMDTIFNELDANGNGVIEAEELPRFRQRRRRA